MRSLQNGNDLAGRGQININQCIVIISGRIITIASSRSNAHLQVRLQSNRLISKVLILRWVGFKKRIFKCDEMSLRSYRDRKVFKKNRLSLRSASPKLTLLACRVGSLVHIAVPLARCLKHRMHIGVVRLLTLAACGLRRPVVVPERVRLGADCGVEALHLCLF